jgi:lipoprotein signal peptidase
MPVFNQRANSLVNSSLTGVKTFAQTDTEKFFTETYKILQEDSLATTGTPNLSYYANTGAAYSRFDSFSKFQVKVVFWSSDERYVPKIKNLIATAVI